MTPSDRAKRLGTSADRFVEMHGDEAWECICDTFPLEKWFKTADAVEAVQKHFGRFTRRTTDTIVRATLISVEDQGTGVLERKGNFWRLPNYPTEEPCDD